MNRIFPVKRRFRASAPNTKLDLSFGQAPFTPDEEPYFEFVREAVGGNLGFIYREACCASRT